MGGRKDKKGGSDGPKIYLPSEAFTIHIDIKIWQHETDMRSWLKNMASLQLQLYKEIK